MAQIWGCLKGDSDQCKGPCATFPPQTKPGWDVLSPRREVGWGGDALPLPGWVPA